MLTKHLEMCIKYLPKNRWFEHDEIPTPVSRNAWVCKRLVEEGILQEKVKWKVDDEKGIENRVDFRTVILYYYDSNSNVIINNPARCGQAIAKLI